jgi:hypothetical protein
VEVKLHLFQPERLMDVPCQLYAHGSLSSGKDPWVSIEYEAGGGTRTGIGYFAEEKYTCPYQKSNHGLSVVEPLSTDPTVRALAHTHIHARARTHTASRIGAENIVLSGTLWP